MINLLGILKLALILYRLLYDLFELYYGVCGCIKKQLYSYSCMYVSCFLL